MASKMNLGEYVVRGADGLVDMVATIGKFSDELVSWTEANERDMAQIASAVHAVFDANKGVAINIPALTGMALQIVGVTPETYSDLSEKVGEYVRSNKAEFAIAKGKGGGVSRLCDKTPKGE